MTHKGVMAVVIAVSTGMSVAVAELPTSLSIPDEEFEAVERDYKAIPMPDPTGHPVQQMMDTLSLDMRGTLPEHVIEEMIGASPYDFTDVAWEMEVTGGFTQSMRGTGTLQVTNFTRGLGASGQIDAETFTGAMGLAIYNAQLATGADYTFTVSAIFPPGPGGEAMGIPIDRGRSLFEMTFGCHMFEPHRLGCSDGSEEYLYTDLPTVRDMHIEQRGGAYRVHFVAAVEEFQRHRVDGLLQHDPTGRMGLVEGWICDRDSWKRDGGTCVAGPSPERYTQHEKAQSLLEAAQRQLEKELDKAVARAGEEATEADIERHVAEIERQAHEDRDAAIRRAEGELSRARAEIVHAEIMREVEQQREDALRQAEAHMARTRAESAQAELERQIQRERDDAIRRVETQLARVEAEIARAEEERRAQRVADESVRRIEAEVARVEGEIARIQAQMAVKNANLQAEIRRDAVNARTEEALAEAREEGDATAAEDEPEEP